MTVFRIIYKDGKATDVKGDKLSYHSTMRMVMVFRHDGTMVATINLDEVRAVKELLDNGEAK
jgi:hypothetical protein